MFLFVASLMLETYSSVLDATDRELLRDRITDTQSAFSHRHGTMSLSRPSANLHGQSGSAIRGRPNAVRSALPS